MPRGVTTVGGSSGFRVTIDDAEVQRALRKMERAAVSAQPAWAEVGEYMKTAVDDTFEAEGKRDEHPRWDKLEDATKAARIGGRAAYLKRDPTKLRAKAARRLAKMKILQVTGRLRRSVWRRASARDVKLGSNVKYAATHQFGRGAIPARPFLFVTRKDWEEIGRILLRHYLSGFPRGPRP